MAEPPRYPGAREHTDDAGIPRWVKVSGMVVVVVVLLVAAVMLLGVGGGGHQPRRHGGAGDDEPPVSVMRDAPIGVTDDGGGHTGRPRAPTDDHTLGLRNVASPRVCAKGTPGATHSTNDEAND
jgi:hypothetical protein